MRRRIPVRYLASLAAENGTIPRQEHLPDIRTVAILAQQWERPHRRAGNAVRMFGIAGVPSPVLHSRPAAVRLSDIFTSIVPAMEAS